MKKIISTFKTTFQNIWQDESAQGATEYILLLVVVVGIAMAFGPKIKTLLAQKMESISTDVNSVTSQ